MVDRQDEQRISGHLKRLLDELRSRRTLTNHEVRQIAGSRGMARVNTLIRDFGFDIDVRKDHGATWLVTYRGRRQAQPSLLEA